MTGDMVLMNGAGEVMDHAGKQMLITILHQAPGYWFSARMRR